ncbi:patatin-like phospholipase family protein [Aquimarina algicola]|uniref:Patatin n=1 Tax=Aquimarina algicola TaxID=2589995 RepID=A0A504J9I2_9FLAO|nr:patatin-like phospholipase family protein [Aquimarina algicola]TPN85255.1 patatin [Aquimarina algicola]
MKRSLLVVITLIFFPLHFFSQDTKPKVALVLSGGGAKGLAHIPTLQALDSLGIVPDLVVGNSMGSIIGGLYAMGYSGDSIASIAKNAKWDKLIGGGVELRSVGVEEKTEFGRYFMTLSLVDKKLKSDPFLLGDQNLRDFLALTTFPVYDIDDFDNLPIPFRAVATDIVNGKEVVLDKGTLADAMRASMSIPVVFSPVPYENTLLIDGGILNNFPTDVAKKLGADIIIGSNVGGGMKTKEKLENISALLFQAGMLNSNLKNKEHKKLCDILLDHSVNLSYSTEDFIKGNEIYEEGKIAVAQNIDQLTTLSKKINKFKQRKHQLPVEETEIIIDTLNYKNVSKANLALARARTNILPNKKYNKQDLFDGIDRAMGTNIFSRITYSPFIYKEKQGLQLNMFEKPKHQFSGALHYDSYRDIGLIVNYTGRNIIGNASRSLITLDIADQPRIRIQHQKNFGPRRNWWLRSEVFGQRFKQKVFINGENADNLRYNDLVFENQLNRDLNSLRSYFGFGITYHNTYIKPEIKPEINDNIFSLDKYNFENINLNAHFSYNSLNEVFFATKGSALRASFSRSVTNNIDVDFFDEAQEDLKGSTNGFSKAGLTYEKRFSIHPRKTMIIGFTTHLIFEDEESTGDISFTDFGISEKNIIGGSVVEPRNESHVFPGLDRGELIVNQFTRLNLGLQLQLVNNIYITPHVDAGTVGFEDFDEYIENIFSAKGEWQDSLETSFLWSTGVTFSYKSILGPLNFDISTISGTNKVRYFIGLGFPLSPSN